MKRGVVRLSRRERRSIPDAEMPRIELWRWVDPDDLTALLPLLRSPFAEVMHLSLRPSFIDMLEESAKTHRIIVVTLRGAAHFADDVRDVVTEQGEDFALFREHGRVAVTDILDCVWSAPRESTHDGKL